MGMKSFRTLNLGNTIISVKLIPYISEDDGEQTFAYVCPTCQEKPIRKHFCQKCNTDVFPIRKFLIEKKENDSINVIGTFVGKLKPQHLVGYYEMKPTTIKGSKVIEDTTGKNRDFRKLLVSMVRNNLVLEGNCVLTTKEKGIVVLSMKDEKGYHLVMATKGSKPKELDGIQLSDEELNIDVSQEFVPLKELKPIEIKQ